MDIPWDDMKLFLAVAEHGSLSAAAKALGIAQPTVSRRLAELEDRLGYLLFVRSVEGASMSAAGDALLEPARRMAEWAAEVERTAEKGNHAPQGVVRITAPPGIAFAFLAPFAAHLRTQLPEVRLEVRSTVQYLDLGRREADLALRFGTELTRDLVAVASLEHRVFAMASEAYVARLPKSYDLADVDWICWAPPYERLLPNPMLAALIPGFRPAFAADDFLVQLRAALAGVGAMLLGDVKHSFSETSGLVPLALDLGAHSRATLQLVCARSALAIPRIRAVADRIADELRKLHSSTKLGAKQVRASSKKRA